MLQCLPKCANHRCAHLWNRGDQRLHLFVPPEVLEEEPALHDPDGVGVRPAHALVHRLARSREILRRVRLGRHLVESVAVVEVVRPEFLIISN